MQPLSFIFNEDNELTQKIQSDIPYAKFINLKVGVDNKKNQLFKLPFEEKNVGNTIIASIHGGLIGGMIETATVLSYQLSYPEMSLPRVVDFSLDYLKAGKLIDMYATCTLIKEGKRIVNFSTKVWQEESEKPIALARVCLQV